MRRKCTRSRYKWCGSSSVIYRFIQNPLVTAILPQTGLFFNASLQQNVLKIADFSMFSCCSSIPFALKPFLSSLCWLIKSLDKESTVSPIMVSIGETSSPKGQAKISAAFWCCIVFMNAIKLFVLFGAMPASKLTFIALACSLWQIALEVVPRTQKKISSAQTTLGRSTNVRLSLICSSVSKRL